jgi:Na+/phosphate symporter
MFKRLFGARAQSTLIDEAFETVSGMLTHAAEMYDIAIGMLLDDRSAEVDLDTLDDRIDDGEREVRRTVLQHLAVDPRHDLVASLILVSIIQDAERIGDFARGLGDLVELKKDPLEGEFADRLRQIAERIRPSFEACATAFGDDDAQGAGQVIEHHVETKIVVKDYVARLAASDLSADPAVVYSSAARMLGRVSAHLSNIASSVVQPYDRIRHGDEEI